MKFFKSLWKSLYDVQFYHTEGQEYTFWKAVWRYTRLFFLIFFVLGTIGMIIFSQFFTKENIVKVTNTSKDIAIQLYPSGLVLDISAESGVVTNSTGPIIFSVDSIKNILTGAGFMADMGYKNRESKKYGNIFVLDTHTTGTIESFNSVFLLNKTQFITQTNMNEKRVYEVSESMKNNPAIHITPEIAQNAINNFSNSIKNNVDAITKFTYIAIAIIILITLIFGSFFVGLFAATSLYLYALIIWVLSIILKTKYSYKQIYSMSVLGFTLPFCLLLAHTPIRILILCIIVGRVMYLHKKGTDEHINN